MDVVEATKKTIVKIREKKHKQKYLHNMEHQTRHDLEEKRC